MAVLVIDVAGLTMRRATRSDLTPNLSDLIAVGAFATMAPFDPAALWGRPPFWTGSALRVAARGWPGIPDASPERPDLELQRWAGPDGFDDRLGAFRGRKLVILSESNDPADPGVFITGFETKLPARVEAAGVVPIIVEALK